jgi:transcriptional regulator with GAF, ATPase, and Fis domain
VSPRLLVIAGPLKDLSYALPSGEVPLGRDPSNLFSINDPSLSRRHCVLIGEGDSYIIRDLASRNGTFVNGVAIKEARLNHGDQISAGDSAFVLLLREESEEPLGGRVEFEDGMAQATAQLRPQDVLYLQPDRILKELPASSRVVRNFNALLRISRAVHSIRDLDQLQEQILRLIFEVIPAERGAILLDGKGEQFASVFARHRAGPTVESVRISRTITRQVLEQRVAILGADVSSSSGLARVESLVISQVRSLLCVPLIMFEKVTGCIYLDTTNAASRFDEDHLQLVAAIAGTSAVALENARRLQWLEQENIRLNTEINLEHNLVGESARMKEVYKFLAQVAPTDSTVLIQGESGTGKELAARAIHRNSPRSGKPFVAINCAAIPEGLLESELFGHERGSFTGAIAQKKGRLEVADGGVVFLDEIGELAPALQVKLLRVLQEREFERVGGTRPISVDIRVIAASNRNIEEAVKAETFRKDLYYRLNVLSLTMPALRERRGDIPLLAKYFAAKCSKKCKTRLKNISGEAMACLAKYDWPGNVRELENAVERALVLSLSDEIRPEDLPESVLEKTSGDDGAARYHREVKNLKRQLILNAWQESKGSYTEAARILGVHVNYLHRLIRNLDLKDSLGSFPAALGTSQASSGQPSSGQPWPGQSLPGHRSVRREPAARDSKEQVRGSGQL